MRVSIIPIVVSFLAIAIHASSLLDRMFHKGMDLQYIMERIKSSPSGRSEAPREEKKPDEQLDMSRWAACGIYALRISQPMDEEVKQHDHNGPVETENLCLFGFRKVYNAHENKWLAHAYPLSMPELTPGSSQGTMGAYRGPVMMYSDGDMIFVISSHKHSWEEEEDGELQLTHHNSAICHKVKMKFPKMDPLKGESRYTGLTFEHNTLCHRYTHLSVPRESQHGRMKCIRDMSEMYVDAFERVPVELLFQGRLEIEAGSSSEKQTRRFTSNAFFKEFEFDMDEKEEKQLLTMPHTVHELCEESEVMEMEDLDDITQAMLHSL